MSNSYVYQINDPKLNRPLYIGKSDLADYSKSSLDKIYERAYSHILWAKDKRCITKHPLYVILKSRIQEGFDISIDILHENLSKEEACLLEIQTIKIFGRLNNRTGILSNLTDGGEGTSGLIWSEERKAEFSRYKSKEMLSKEDLYFKSKTHSEKTSSRLTNLAASGNHPLHKTERQEKLKSWLLSLNLPYQIGRKDYLDLGYYSNNKLIKAIKSVIGVYNLNLIFSEILLSEKPKRYKLLISELETANVCE
jgi:hypothetical protein